MRALTERRRDCTRLAAQLINNAKDVVDEMLDGVTLNPGLQRLDGYNVVVRKNIDKSKVALISGGGSGHEPSHAGWVGPGMLTAAVAGPVFASPASLSVLAAIMHVTGSGGCLVIVKNYTGDRLWFGLACEQAKAAGLNVELVVVGDDCALADRGLGIAGRRGVAGTVLVHKIAGAAAEAGLSLSEVAAEARAAAAAVGSMGVALRTCTLPGQPREERIEEGQMEVGLGIHGEPGAMVTKLQPVDAVVDTLLGYITSQEPGRSYVTLAPAQPVALLVNNLGGSTGMELAVATRRAVATLEGAGYGVRVERCWTGAFMTALDMVGLSLSVMCLTPSMIERLDAPCAAPAWPGSGAVNRERVAPAPSLPSGCGGSLTSLAPPAGAVLLGSAQAAAVGTAIRAAAAAMIAAESQLTAWDEVCGDGDCGSTLTAGATAVLAEVDSYALNHPTTTALGLATSLGKSMGGSSGALYSIFLNAAAVSLADAPPTAATAAAAFAAGCAHALVPHGAPTTCAGGVRVCATLRAMCGLSHASAPVAWPADRCEAMSAYGGATKGHRTMLDALLPAAEAMRAATASGSPAAAALAAAASAAEAGAEATKTMVAAAGRASYVPKEVISSVPDPGAMAVALWLRAVAASVQ